MAQIAQRTDVIEEHAARALPIAICALLAFGIATILFIFQGDGILLGLAWVLVVAGVGGIGYAAYSMFEAKKVPAVFTLECIFCNEKFDLLERPGDIDVTCPHCHHLIPMRNDVALPVSEVRCGFCNSLNFYSEKSQFLICENCDRQIPISVGDDVAPKHIPKGYTVEDDDKTYQLTLDEVTNAEHPTEELVACLQHMLALNRAQVKQMLGEVPTTLLVGIPKKKAEMLQAQLSVHGAIANFTAMD